MITSNNNHGLAVGRMLLVRQPHTKIYIKSNWCPIIAYETGSRYALTTTTKFTVTKLAIDVLWKIAFLEILQTIEAWKIA